MNNEGWNFDNTYIQLPKIFYKNQLPTAAPTPQMVIFNQNLAESLGLNADTLKKEPAIFAGCKLPMGANPIAQAYAGYQFGHFTMLGDGRAVLLGEQITPAGQKFDIQLKGSGITPFSRGGDGYAALKPMLREYIISEAMFHLGLPTTRSLAVALTGKTVMREKALQGAVLTRTASSHIRVGTFNFISAFGTQENTRTLADYCINRHFSELKNHENKYILFMRKAAEKQAALIASWQLIGFVHGVMNTDNMAISGETIDYGPCAFMDSYNPNTVFSSIDTHGRYAYKNQPTIGAWNLSRFAEELLFLFHEDKEKAAELARQEINYYWECYNEHWLNGMRAKLGITHPTPEDTELIAELLGLMAAHKLDYTNTFHSLSSPVEPGSPLLNIAGFIPWQHKWHKKMDNRQQMKKHNPAVIPRNYKVEEALEAADNGDFSVMHNLLDALSKPYEYSSEYSLPPKAANCDYKTFCGT